MADKPAEKSTDGLDRGPGNFVLNLVFRGIIGAALLLPYQSRVRAMGWVCSRLLAPVLGWRRRIRANLAHVFPEMPKAEVERLVRAVPDNAGRSIIEIYSGRAFIERVQTIVPQGPGLAALEQAKTDGRPVLLVTGHIGNYDAPRAWLADRGYPVGGLYEQMRNGWFNDHYVAAISGIAAPVFPRGRAGMGGMLRFLKGGGMLGIVIDTYMAHGKMLDFIGKPAPTALSAAEMALKYDALVVPIYGLRRDDGLNFDIIVEAPVPHGDPEAMTQALNDSLTALVRKHPGQWFWIHRRWKPELHPEVNRG